MNCYEINRSIAGGCEFGWQYLLNVTGGVGAIWGPAEVLYLRNSADPTNNLAWRVTSIGIGFILGSIRFSYQNIPLFTRWADRVVFGITPTPTTPIEDTTLTADNV